MKKALKVVFLTWWLFYGWKDSRFQMMPVIVGPFGSEAGCLSGLTTFEDMLKSLGLKKPDVSMCKYISL